MHCVVQYNNCVERDRKKKEKKKTMANQLTHEWVQERNTALRNDSTARLARNVVTQAHPSQALVDRERMQSLTNVFSHKVKTEGKATNQSISGRCWMFAALNVLRQSMMEKYNLPSDFELSQSYLFFYDKLERANFFMEQIIDTADQAPSSREVMHLLSSPLDDGGQLAMFQALLTKHGVVPKSVYGESEACGKPGHMNSLITRKLRDAAPKLRELANEGSTSELVKFRKEIMEMVHRILVVYLGQPPESFDWIYYDKDKKYHAYTDMTPRKFYDEMVPVRLEDFVSVVNDPRHEYYKLYSVSRLGNVVGTAYNVRYLNLPIEELKRMARAKLESGRLVWFGCDVAKDLVSNPGVLDTKLLDYSLVFGAKPEMDKRMRLVYGDAMMTHAMAFSGFHTHSSGEKSPVTKWRVENSWGDKSPHEGYLIMTDEWFSEHVYQLAVETSDLSEEAKEAWMQREVTFLPPWDPMGALA
eukprot:gb/GECG01001710.1/.p1 GENE.gb/GECG01001710.1/~~gb/GECG01001710.1/.p1  ORF type:complete len:472 (+),score=56.74 gb/GECG01001710.1/:1-1416(+)